MADTKNPVSAVESAKPGDVYKDQKDLAQPLVCDVSWLAQIIMTSDLVPGLVVWFQSSSTSSQYHHSRQDGMPSIRHCIAGTTACFPNR